MYVHDYVGTFDSLEHVARNKHGCKGGSEFVEASILPSTLRGARMLASFFGSIFKAKTRSSADSSLRHVGTAH